MYPESAHPCLFQFIKKDKNEYVTRCGYRSDVARGYDAASDTVRNSYYAGVW